MVKVLFVCHGNICRSPMAEFILKDIVKKEHIEDKFYISSAATSTEALGMRVHYGTRQKLQQHGIFCDGKRAVQINIKDYDKYDYILCMDSLNIRNLSRIIPCDPNKKIYKLLDFSKNPRDIEDPWYTDNFDITYDDIYEGCKSFVEYLKEQKKY